MTNEVIRTRSVLLYYFSGTGNSKRLAEVTAKRFEEAGFKVKIKNIEKNSVKAEHNDYSYHGFIFPSLGFGIPQLMTEFMQALPPVTEKDALIIVSMGNKEYHIPPSEGKCLGQGKRILERRGYKVIGGDAIAMPNNWITGWSAPPPEKAALIVKAGEKAVGEFTEKIIDGEFYMKKSHWLSKLLGITINPFMLYGLNYLYLMWYTDDKCSSCEVCAKTCPVENIVMVNSKPKWGKECFWCHRCINLCPQESIQGVFIGTTRKRRRYKEPHLKVNDLIRE